MENELLLKQSCVSYFKEFKNNSVYIGNYSENDLNHSQNNTSTNCSEKSNNSTNTSNFPKACSPQKMKILLNHPKTKSPQSKTEVTEQIKLNKFFLKNLPKISHKDYQGKEICPACFKIVMENNQSISCDQCHRWTHRICCKMTQKNYKDLKTQIFNFLCRNCNKKDIDYLNIFQKELKKAELPDPLNKIKPKKNHILILNLNCRNLANKGEELYTIIITSDADIICLTETWFDESHPLSMHVPEGYFIHRKDRSDEFNEKYKKTKGGGVAIMYKKSLKLVVKEKLTPKIEEILWVQVRAKTSFLLGVLYRPDYSDMLTCEKENLEENIMNAISISKNTILTGDFNADLLDPKKNETKKLKNILKSNGFIQHIQKPTRIDHSSFRKSLLDHFWSSNETIQVEKCGTFYGLSDHLGTYMNLNIKKEKEPPIKIKFRDYKSFDPNTFKNDIEKELKNSNFNELLEKNVNAATEKIVETISKIAEKHAPLTEKTILPKTHPPWYTKDLRNKISEKNNLLKDFYETGHPSLKKRLKTENKEIKNTKFHLKKDFVNEKVEKADSDISELWKLLNLLTDKPKSKNIEPDKITKEKANDFNKFFATVGSSIQEKLKEKLDKTALDKKFDGIDFCFVEEKDETIKKLIKNIDDKVATGEDNISAKLIKYCNEEITPYLTKIINQGYKTKTFPDILKKAIIKPIFKKGDPNDISNYRPISILSIISKIFERCAGNQMINFLIPNNIIHPSQHAYQKGHSPITCLFELLNEIYNAVDNRMFVAVASLDLSKAFDSISHDLLLKKLLSLGIGNDATAWIKSYLSNRIQKTKFEHFMSDWEIVQSGVPQGSILGPLLFLCFTNDLPNTFENKCDIFSYADDSQLLVKSKNKSDLEMKLKTAISTAQSWYTKNSMLNNTGKTELIIFHPKDKNDEISIEIMDEGEKITLKSKENIKILGLYIDNELKWTKQVKTVKKKSMNTTRRVHRINYFLPKNLRMILYHALISPQFDFGDIFYGGCNEKDARSLQRVQNFAVKSITGNRKFDSATKSFQETKLLNLKTRRKVHESVFAHKALQMKSAQNTTKIYQSYVHEANTRRAKSNKLNIPAHNYSKFKKSPLYRTIQTWNEAPPNLPVGNIKLHKNHFQKHLINKAYKKSP